ncbi:MAG: hypothetical protein OEV42_19390 [Deltaproteobacteria bacterium]|nr:hypothetical protein [Deltaproteobacteria bacterium]
MKGKLFKSIGILIFLIISCSVQIQDESEKSEIIQSFEGDLNDPEGGKKFNNSVISRFDTTKYGEFIFKSASVVGDTACLIYHAEDPMQSEKVWGTKIKNFAIKLIKEDGEWVVNAINIMPGDKVESYNNWLKSQGCMEDY